MSEPETDKKVRNILIIGGGIIGCATAYYLSEHPLLSDSTSKSSLLSPTHCYTPLTVLTIPSGSESESNKPSEPIEAESQPEIRVTLLESNHPASGASGKSGGLVARWAYPRSLVDVSFAEHARLAKKWNGERRWGWREVECGRWEGRGIRREAGVKGMDGTWVVYPSTRTEEVNPDHRIGVERRDEAYSEDRQRIERRRRAAVER